MYSHYLLTHFTHSLDSLIHFIFSVYSLIHSTYSLALLAHSLTSVTYSFYLLILILFVHWPCSLTDSLFSLPFITYSLTYFFHSLDHFAHSLDSFYSFTAHFTRSLNFPTHFLYSLIHFSHSISLLVNSLYSLIVHSQSSYSLYSLAQSLYTLIHLLMTNFLIQSNSLSYSDLVWNPLIALQLYCLGIPTSALRSFIVYLCIMIRLANMEKMAYQ